MQLTINLHGTTALILGRADATRRAVRRYTTQGATVCTATTPGDVNATMLDGVALVVPVDDGQPGWVPILTMCQRLGILVAPEPAATPGGRVTLVGGGPGPTDLLSVRAVAALRDADVVFYGCLGPQDLGLLALVRAWWT